MTNAARLLRGALPVLAALTAASACALPSYAADRAGAPGTPSVTRGDLWWLAALNVPAAWRAVPGAGSGVTVAVLSTGVDATHPDLTGTVTTGPDFADTGRKHGGPYWGDEGTAVAGLIAGRGHGAGAMDGVTGVAPGARILSVQVTLEYDDPLNSDAAITRRLPDAIAQGIRYAVNHGATVIALPLDPGTLGSAADGDPAAAGGSPAERAAIGYAVAHDVVLIAPAGDNGASTDTANYPAAYADVIAVGATARNGQLAPFSSTQPYVALTAPGSDETPLVPEPFGESTDPTAGLTVPAPDGSYQSLASTDMAAALTAGVAALIRARYPLLTVAQVTRALETSASASARTRGAGWGHGALNAAAALTAATTIAAAHPAPAPRPTPTVPAPRPTVARHSAAAPVGSGTTVQSFLIDLVIGACVLIAILIAAMTLARIRLRRRDPRRGHPSQARHSRNQPPPTPALLPPHPAIRPDSPARPSTIAGGSAWFSPPPANGFAARSGAPHRSLQSPRSGEAPLAPWERSPADFAMAPLPQDAPWPTSTTGPMYVWNPSATGPQQTLDHDDQA